MDVTKNHGKSTSDTDPQIPVSRKRGKPVRERRRRHARMKKMAALVRSVAPSDIPAEAFDDAQQAQENLFQELQPDSGE